MPHFNFFSSSTPRLAEIGVSEEQISPILQAIRVLLITRTATADARSSDSPSLGTILRPPTLFRNDTPSHEPAPSSSDTYLREETSNESLQPNPVSESVIKKASNNSVLLIRARAVT